MKLILYLKEFKTELKIDGILSNPSEITWSIEGNKSANTTIDQKGLLQVGATEPSYVPDVTIPGTYYYYVEVTNTNENKFNKFLNKITFGYFFKDTASVKIVSNDELSGVLKTEYQLVSNEDEFNKDGVWIE
ncbi:MAG: hypothetical protein PUD42_06610 [Clostridiales bacterium]|nr:hypothetical protein [Clostridiales bacterium]